MTKLRGPEDWTGEHVRRFWDYYVSQDARHSTYFGASAGASVVNLLALSGVLHGRVLDFGCGPGLILERLCRENIEAYGVDSSALSIDRALRRCQGLPGFREVRQVADGPTPWPDGFFDLIVCCETMEHVPPAIAALIYAEQFRLLKPGGHLLMTTPANEDLQQAMTYCPFCESEFHMWQHMRSLSPESLRCELLTEGFEVVCCDAIDLFGFDPQATLLRAPRFGRLVSWSCRQFLTLCRVIAPEKARCWERRWRTFPGQHLVALATKPQP